MAVQGVDLLAAVKEALAALYHHPDDAIRRRADKWLQDFQRTLDAWQVADSLLHDSTSNIETLMFCSQTLRYKVQRDFEELPSEAFRPLQNSLYELLKRFNTGPPKVRTQICIAVVALAVHVTEEDWGSGGIVNWISDEMRAHPEYIPCFLELLNVLPQEAQSHKIAARPERRRQFDKELASSAPVALDLLSNCLNFEELKEQVLVGFCSWLRASQGVPASTLATHSSLVEAALSALYSDQYLEAAVNVTSELIHLSVTGNSGDISTQLSFINFLVSRVMGLKALLKDSSKDEEDVKAIARLFADMGDSYVELISTGSKDAMLIVHALLEVASHPEYDICYMTYNFWHNLSVNLTKRESYLSCGSESSAAAERSRRLEIFRSSFEAVVSLVSYRVEYPENYAELSPEDHKDFKRIRDAVSDVLLDATEVLGGDATLKILSSKLVLAVRSCSNEQNCKWQPVEAVLFCMQAIAKSISAQESEILPQVMALLPKLPQNDCLLQTVCLTIGAFSKWIDASPDITILRPLVEILNRGMRVSEDAASSASVAFKYICEDCRKKFAGSMNELFQIYRIAISGDGGYKVSLEDSMHLVEALSVVITELPQGHAIALELLCSPAIDPLQEIVNRGEAALQEISPRQLTIHIDRLARIFRRVVLPEVVANAVRKFWPIFKAIFDKRAWDMRTMESLCRCCKNAVRTCGRFMGFTVGVMLEEIKALYQQHNQPCFLYLSSEVIKIFGSDPSCADYLKSLIEVLYSHTIKLLTSIDNFTARPDIADDCFLLASRCMRYCPDLFVPSCIFASLVDCAMVGMTIQHREACKSILSFLSDVFDSANNSTSEMNRAIINSVVLPRGSSLTRILIASLAGALPPSRLEDVSYVLMALSRACSTKVLEWASGALSLIPPAALTDAERLNFLQAISNAAAGSSIDSLIVPFEEFSDVCRRNRTVQDIVQGALRPQQLILSPIS